jgi:hypothetical protein
MQHGKEKIHVGRATAAQEAGVRNAASDEILKAGDDAFENSPIQFGSSFDLIREEEN